MRQIRPHTSSTRTIAAVAALVAVVGIYSQAATLSWSSTAPTVDGADIANFSGVSADADNVNDGGDDGTYIANNRPAISQTFTTGSNPGGYQFNAITLQHVLYSSDTTWWTVDSGWAGTGNPFEIKIGTKEGTTSFDVISLEYAPMVVSGNAALDASGDQSGQGTGWYLTMTLDTPLTLDPNTTYGFSIWSPGPFIEVNGDGTTSGNYTGGEAFGVWGSTITDYTGDHVFHLDMVTNSAAAMGPASTRPTTDPVATTDLSGTWSFTPMGESQTTIQVPGGGWYKQGFTGVDEADYETSVTITNIGEPQVTWLEFGAVNYEAILSVDGTVVATNVQSFTPASFDISSYVTPGNTYDVRVHVKGRNAFMSGGKSLVPNAAGWSPNTPQGIFRSTELKIYPQVYISDVFVKPSVSSNSLYYDVSIRNVSSTATNVTLSGNLSSWNDDSWSYPALPSQPISLAGGESTNITVGPVNWNLGTGSYWWPNVPYQEGYQAKLHNLNLSLAPTGGGADLHTTAVRFGFRECVQQGDGMGNTCYFLNGIRVNFRGDNLQGANYDSIVYDWGRGDAFGTLPGFLPGPNGWPKAVDQYQRLNFNVVRLHQEPVTPYMLDVCDEMGLMLIEETAIRGSADDQNFISGHENMVNHLKALFTRDRNHPSIVRQSLSNEPNQSATDSTQFETDLYNAAMSVDGTRPVSIDVGVPVNTYETMTYSNFSVYRHYGSGNQWGQYTDEVFARSDRPFGQGEFIWPVDNTPRGFTWFGTTTQAMRSKGASDVRPYTLLSAWASLIPGVQTGQMELEQGGHSLYGEDNLADPWVNAQFQRVQAGFHPVLVVDSNYWESVKLSNVNGDWPAYIPFIAPGQSVARTLTIYNDTFDGTAVDVFWEFRQDAPDGPLVASGVINATVPLGYTQSQDITFPTPNAPEGTSFYLVLYTKKDGVEMFRENSQQFLMVDQAKLSGTAFGASPAWAPGSEFDKATDGDPATFYDSQNADGGYTGIDLGMDNSNTISAIVFAPRTGFEYRMDGGVFEGSLDGIDYTTIYTIDGTPPGTTTVLINPEEAYRFLRYVGPSASHCNIAEMEFYTPMISVTPATATNLTFGVSDSTLTLEWPEDYRGWWLQVQTNTLNVGLGTNWVHVPSSSLTNKVLLPMDVTKGSVFYRLTYP